ncbi:MAG: hypothetical protein U0T81_00830 [Saprospiraceae bacterium]
METGFLGQTVYSCAELGDARCSDQHCRDILINDDIPNIANDLVPNQSICATTNIFIPYDALRANNSMSGGVFTAVVSAGITGIAPAERIFLYRRLWNYNSIIH